MKKTNTATIFDIQRGSYVDGPGIRTTVFFKGCNLRCAWCHNPESQSFEAQMLFYQSKCTECGKCEEKCPNHRASCDLCGRCTFYCPQDARELCGNEYTTDEVLGEMLKDRALYENTGGGVTFSGGECMLRIDFLEAILKECKQKGIHTAVDTAGHLPWDHFERILPYTDLFLYDIKSMDEEIHRQYVGVDNRLILENLARLLRSDASIWVRMPVVAGVNDRLWEMQCMKLFFEENGYPDKIELLPYHPMGEHKYAALGRTAETFAAPKAETIEELKNIILTKREENA